MRASLPALQFPSPEGCGSVFPSRGGVSLRFKWAYAIRPYNPCVEAEVLPLHTIFAPTIVVDGSLIWYRLVISDFYVTLSGLGLLPVIFLGLHPFRILPQAILFNPFGIKLPTFPVRTAAEQPCGQGCPHSQLNTGKGARNPRKDARIPS